MYFIYISYICMCIMYICFALCIIYIYIYMYYVVEKTNNVPYQSANGLVVTHGLGDKMTHNA